MRERCKLCGGNAGIMVGGAHYLCAELARLGLPAELARLVLPIPSLGEACEACHGKGRIPRSAGPLINPTKAMIDAWAPPCTACGGRGIIKGEMP